jgi:hypothetical protein
MLASARLKFWAAAGLSELGSGRELSLGSLRPGEKRIKQRDDSGPMLQPLGRRGEAGFVRDGVELGDLVERRFGYGRLRPLPRVEDSSTAMAPAGDLGDRRHCGVLAQSRAARTAPRTVIGSSVLLRPIWRTSKASCKPMRGCRRRGSSRR